MIAPLEDFVFLEQLPHSARSHGIKVYSFWVIQGSSPCVYYRDYVTQQWRVDNKLMCSPSMVLGPINHKPQVNSGAEDLADNPRLSESTHALLQVLDHSTTFNNADKDQTRGKPAEVKDGVDT